VRLVRPLDQRYSADLRGDATLRTSVCARCALSRDLVGLAMIRCETWSAGRGGRPM